MIRFLSPILVLLLLSPHCQAERMKRSEQPDEVGLVTISRSYLHPDPPAYQVPDAGFESPSLPRGNGWSLQGWELKEGPDAPEGKQVLQSQHPGRLRLVFDGFPIPGSSPMLVSLWLKTEADQLRALFSAETDQVRYGKHTNLILPNTQGQWRRVGFYVRPPVGAGQGRFQLNLNQGARISVDDLWIRPVTEAEFGRAWAGWRAKYPPRDLSPRPSDGQHLALFLQKALAPPDVTSPLLIMGIGSSYTNMLGNGERMVQHLRSLGSTRPIIYKKHVGSAVNYDFTKGWMLQHVVEQQPDLVILYSGGVAPDLDELLQNFRARSTADVLVASLHLRERDEVISPQTIDTPEWDAIRDVCRKHGVEFVENRREWAAYLRSQNQQIPFLLKDAVHQNDHGALVINENLVRHVVENIRPSYDPRDRERILRPGASASFRQGESVSVADDGIQIRFRGNRLDLYASAEKTGTAYQVLIDGMPASEFPAFHRTLIVPGSENHRPERGSTADRSPHRVDLGENLVPQDWTIRMTSDEGDYELVGSVTGPDGRGHSGSDFVSQSGQIIIPTALWRRRVNPDGSYSNRKGDVFTFRTYRAALSEVVFEEAGRSRFSLVQNASNTWHEITLVPKEGFPARLLQVRVFEPPLDRRDP